MVLGLTLHIARLNFLYGSRSSALTGTIVNTINTSTPILNHKYYGRHYLKTNGNATSDDNRFELYAGDGTGLNWVFGNNIGNYSTWTMESKINTITELNASSGFKIRNFVVNGVNTVYSDGLMLIDLTADFGAGNEPSKAWCDKNIPFFIGNKNIKV